MDLARTLIIGAAVSPGLIVSLSPASLFGHAISLGVEESCYF